MSIARARRMGENSEILAIAGLHLKVKADGGQKRKKDRGGQKSNRRLGVPKIGPTQPQAYPRGSRRKQRTQLDAHFND